MFHGIANHILGNPNFWLIQTVERECLVQDSSLGRGYSVHGITEGGDKKSCFLFSSYFKLNKKEKHTNMKYIFRNVMQEQIELLEH